MRVCPFDDTQLRHLENQIIASSPAAPGGSPAVEEPASRLQAEPWICSKCGFVGTFIDVSRYPEIFPDQT